MGLFQTTPEFYDIEKEIMMCSIHDKIAKFECFSDNIATFSCYSDSTHHEFNVIGLTEFLSEMQIQELINEPDITYFSHSIFYGGEKQGERIWSLRTDFGVN